VSGFPQLSEGDIDCLTAEYLQVLKALKSTTLSVLKTSVRYDHSIFPSIPDVCTVPGCSSSQISKYSFLNSFILPYLRGSKEGIRLRISFTGETCRSRFTHSVY